MTSHPDLSHEHTYSQLGDRVSTLVFNWHVFRLLHILSDVFVKSTYSRKYMPWRSYYHHLCWLKKHLSPGLLNHLLADPTLLWNIKTVNFLTVCQKCQTIKLSNMLTFKVVHTWYCLSNSLAGLTVQHFFLNSRHSTRLLDIPTVPSFAMQDGGLCAHVDISCTFSYTNLPLVAIDVSTVDGPEPNRVPAHGRLVPRDPHVTAVGTSLTQQGWRVHATSVVTIKQVPQVSSYTTGHRHYWRCGKCWINDTV